MAYLPDDLGSEGVRGGNEYFCSTVLDSPILLTDRWDYLSAVETLMSKTRPGDPLIYSRRLFSTLSAKEKRAFNIIQAVPDYNSYTTVDPDQYPTVFSMIPTGCETQNYTESNEVASQYLRDIVQALRQWAGEPKNRAPVRGDLLGSVLEGRLSRATGEELLAYKRYHQWAEAIGAVEQAAGKKKGHTTQGESLGKGIRITTNFDIALVRLRTQSKTHRMVLTWNQVLMIKDALHSRLQVLAAARVIHPGDPEVEDIVLSTIAWQESCLALHGNAGYELLKSCESLAKAYLSVISNDPLADAGPYPRMLEKVRKKETSIGHAEGVEFRADAFTPVLERCKSVAHVVEVYGLQKISGHPLIDPFRGGRASAAEARAPDRTLPSDALRLRWEFSRMFLEGYIQETGSWPPIEFDSHSTRLSHLCAVQARRIDRFSYPLEDWGSARLGKVLEFDFSPNYLDLMDDKSIAHYRSNIACNWDKSVEPLSHKRLLLEMLSREEISPKEIVFMVMRREVPLDWFIVCLHPKEREFKLSPRMFGMLVMEMRLFFALAESNLADQVFRYLPAQTMTLPRTEISRRFHKMTRPVANDTDIRMFLEFDFSAWNLNWRELAVHAVGDVLDDLFGMPGVYTFTHEFFRQSLMVVRLMSLEPEGIRLPEPPESELCWRDHTGGVEGLSQKGWTVCTYPIMSLAMSTINASYWLTGQADNQIMSVSWTRDTRPEKEQLKEMRDSIVNNVVAESAKVNQRMNPDECLEFTDSVTYSKDVYVKGVYYPTSLKFHSRLFPQSSKDFPSMRSNIGTVFSTALAGAERSNSPLSSLFLASLHAGLYIRQLADGVWLYGDWFKEYFGKYTRKDMGQFCLFLFSLPPDLGGLPVVTHPAFVYKGGSDPLTKAVAGLTMLAKLQHTRLYNRMAAQVQSADIYSKCADPARLILDPYSIPLNKRATPVSAVLAETVERMTGKINNTCIYEIVSQETASYCEDLVQALATIRPFNPLILHDILDCSVYGVSDMIKRMFVATRTIQQAVRMTGASIVPRLLETERSGMVYLADRYSSLPGRAWKPETIWDMTGQCRRRWAEAGVPEPVGLSTLSPFDCPVEWDTIDCGVEGVKALVTNDKSHAQSHRGPFDPYIGGKVKEKRSEHGYKIVSTDLVATAFRKLQLISSQIGKDPYIQRLIDLVGLSRSDVILSNISALLPTVKGGTLSHRYAARAGYQSAYAVGSPNFATHCAISSDDCGVLSGGNDDYSVMFNEYFLVAIWLLENTPDWRGGATRSLTLRTDRLQLTPIPDVTLTSLGEPEVPILRLTGNELVFQSSLRLAEVGSSYRSVGLDMTRGVFGDVALDRKQRQHILEGWFGEIMRSGNAARAVADDPHSVIPSAQLDVAEVIGAGGWDLIRAIAYTVLDFAINDIIRPQRGGHPRWEITTYITRACTLCTTSIYNGITHRLMAGDSAVQRLSAWPKPRYAGGFSNTISCIAGEAVSRCLVLMASDDEAYYQRKTALFLSARRTALLEEKIKSVSRLLWQAKNMGMLSQKQIRTILLHNILPAIRGARTEESKLATLNYGIHRSETWVSIQGWGSLAARLRGIRTGDSIIGYVISNREAVRLLRAGPQTGQGTARVFPRSVYIGGSNWPSLAANVLPRYIAPLMTTQLEGIITAINFRRQHSLNRFGVHELTWRQFSPDFTNSHVVVIGSGLGTVAAVALESHADFVHGLDLGRDVDVVAHRFVDYSPFYVRKAGREAEYRQIRTTFTTSGSWYDPEVQGSVAEILSDFNVVVIDIESGTRLSARETLGPLQRIASSCLILWRVTCSTDEAMAIYTDLRSSDCKVSLICNKKYMSPDSYIFCVRRLMYVSNEQRVAYHIEPTAASDEEPPQNHDENRKYELLASATLGLCGSCSNMGLSTARGLLADRARGVLHDAVVRTSYDEWTSLLTAILSVTVGSEPSETLSRLVVDCMGHGVLAVKIGATTHNLTKTRALAMHLLKHASAIIACDV